MGPQGLFMHYDSLATASCNCACNLCKILTKKKHIILYKHCHSHTSITVIISNQIYFPVAIAILWSLTESRTSFCAHVGTEGNTLRLSAAYVFQSFLLSMYLSFNMKNITEKYQQKSMNGNSVQTTFLNFEIRFRTTHHSFCTPHLSIPLTKKTVSWDPASILFFEMLTHFVRRGSFACFKNAALCTSYF